MGGRARAGEAAQVCVREWRGEFSIFRRVVICICACGHVRVRMTQRRNEAERGAEAAPVRRARIHGRPKGVCVCVCVCLCVCARALEGALLQSRGRISEGHCPNRAHGGGGYLRADCMCSCPTAGADGLPRRAHERHGPLRAPTGARHGAFAFVNAAPWGVCICECRATGRLQLSMPRHWVLHI